MTEKTTEQVSTWNPNPEGKGGFQDHPELRNPGGRPKNDESFTYWMRQFKNMTVGAFRKWEQENPEDERTVAATIAYARVGLARKDLAEFKEVADRTEGKSNQNINVSGRLSESSTIISIINPRNAATQT